MPNYYEKAMNDTWQPSPEDLELLSTADGVIMEQHQVFCFDRDEFVERLRNGGSWQQLIQAHLYFEHVVAQLLKEALAKPEAISLSRMGFGQRLDLVVAMALLPDEMVRPIRKISGLRNKIAHDLNFEVAESDVRELENCTPVHLRDAMRAEKDKKEEPLGLNDLLTVILLNAELIRQHRAGRREVVRKSELRLRAVLSKIPQKRYVP